MHSRKYSLKTPERGLMILALLAMLATGWFSAVAPGAAQSGDMLPMDIGASGPDGQVIGAQFSVSTLDGTFLGSCTLEGIGDEPWRLSCLVDVPLDTTVVVTLDESTIPPGSVPVENPIYFDTSGGPGGASHWGVFFEIQSQSSGSSTGQTAQELANGGSWSMGIQARTSGEEYPGYTFGARFVVTSEDGNFIGECTLEVSDTTVPWYNCRVEVPSDRISLVWEDLDSLPAGYAPVENPIEFDPTVYIAGPHNIGAVFHNEPTDGSTSTGQTSDVAIVTTENGQPAYDACFVLVDFSNEGCDRNGDGQITFEDVPLGTYTLRQTADLGSGRSVPDSTITVSGTTDSDGWERFYPEIVSGSNAGSDSDSVQGSVDISLITRDPDDGHLLTGACYVVGQSNEGCDENGDGQVTFADIPFGTFTVRQTQTPAGYPTINDYTIDVQPPGYMEGPVSPVPVGFIVKQAPEQNAPNTRNVSVLMIDMATHEKVPGLCVELIGASNVGCDEDLLDGQVDFLDVPAGGPYELSFPNLPAGYQIGMVGGPLAVSIDASSSKPANLTLYVLVATPNGTGGTLIEPADSGANDSLGSSSTSNASGATVLMTFHACPEGFDPAIGDYFTDCTIPLDAPDESKIIWGGDGQGGTEIIRLDRQYNGTYVYHAGPGTMDLELFGLAPVVRDAYEVIGFDSANGDSYTINLVDGEIREVFIFYYYA